MKKVYGNPNLSSMINPNCRRPRPSDDHLPECQATKTDNSTKLCTDTSSSVSTSIHTAGMKSLGDSASSSNQDEQDIASDGEFDMAGLVTIDEWVAEDDESEEPEAKKRKSEKHNKDDQLCTREGDEKRASEEVSPLGKQNIKRELRTAAAGFQASVIIKLEPTNKAQPLTTMVKRECDEKHLNIHKKEAVSSDHSPIPEDDCLGEEDLEEGEVSSIEWSQSDNSDTEERCEPIRRNVLNETPNFKPVTQKEADEIGNALKNIRQSMPQPFIIDNTRLPPLNPVGKTNISQPSTSKDTGSFVAIKRDLRPPVNDAEEQLAPQNEGFYIDRASAAYTNIESELQLPPLKSNSELYDLVLYCDLCHTKLTLDTADGHLKLHGHMSASLYEIPKLEETQSLNSVQGPPLLPQNQRVFKAEVVKLKKEIAVREADIICACVTCNVMTGALMTSPFHINAHIKEHKGTLKTAKQMIKQNQKVCQYYKAIGPPVTVYQDYAHLVKVFSKNRFPCLQCKFTRSKAKSTAKHMDEKSHWPWTSENAQAGGEEMSVAFCVSCDDKVFVTGHQLLVHLRNEHHTKKDPLVDAVHIVFRKYRLLKSETAIQFADIIHQNEFYAKLQVELQKEKSKKNLVNQPTGPHDHMDTPLTHTTGVPPLIPTPPPELVGGHAPLSAPPRLFQQYVCDLCHVPLGDMPAACHRHMSTFRHPSISVYNTSIHPVTGEVSILSVHHACVYYNADYDYQSVLCMCAVAGCGFISAEPFTNVIHQQIIHKTKFEDCLVNFYNFLHTSSHRVAVEDKRQVICHRCGDKFESKHQLYNHMAGMKHHMFTPKTREHLDVGRCQLCTAQQGAGAAARHPRNVYSTESTLLDHLYKHIPKQLLPGRPFELYFSVSSFTLVKPDQRAVPFTSEVQFNEVRSYVLTTLIRHPQTSKLSKKRYKAALRCQARI